MTRELLPALDLPCPAAPVQPCVSRQKNAEHRGCLSSPFMQETKAPKRSKCVLTNTSVCVCSIFAVSALVGCRWASNKDSSIHELLAAAQLPEHG